MIKKSDANIELKNFDELWGILGDPALVEKKLKEMLDQAEFSQDKSIYLQMLSQIALTQALQKKFEDACYTLDSAQKLLLPEYQLAQARIFLERARLLQQEVLFGDKKKEQLLDAKSYLEKAFNLCKKEGFDFFAIDAAHMIAIIAENIDEKIAWNERAISLALNTHNSKAASWLGSLYNNLGRNYEEKKQYDEALLAFKKALEHREQEGYKPNIRIARWSVANMLRLINHLDEALVIQLALAREYDDMARSGSIDMPLEMFKLTQGWIYEEIALTYHALTKKFAQLAYINLSNNEMFCTTSPERLTKLKHLQEL